MLRIVFTLLALFSLAACAGPLPGVTPGAQPSSIPPAPTTAPAALNVVYHKTGGLAGVNQSTTLQADGAILLQGGQTRRAPDGAQSAALLAQQIDATGIYAVAPGKYMPYNQCCDRFTYELTLLKTGKSYQYTTMDATSDAPPALMQTIALIEKYLAAAK